MIKKKLLKTCHRAVSALAAHAAGEGMGCL